MVFIHLFLFRFNQRLLCLWSPIFLVTIRLTPLCFPICWSVEMCCTDSFYWYLKIDPPSTSAHFSAACNAKRGDHAPVQSCGILTEHCLRSLHSHVIFWLLHLCLWFLYLSCTHWKRRRKEEKKTKKIIYISWKMLKKSVCSIKFSL